MDMIRLILRTANAAGSKLTEQILETSLGHVGFAWATFFKRWIVVTFKGAVFFSLVLFTSIVIYTTFHQYYLPSVSHESDVRFKFSSCINGPGVCSFPRAEVSLIDNRGQPLLSAGVEYSVFLQLEMPESPANQQNGLFMIGLKTFDCQGQLVRTTSVPSMLRYRSWLLHYLRTLMLFPWMMVGLVEEKQIVNTDIFQKYFEDVDKPATMAEIELRTTDVQFYSARLVILANFHGVRRWMFNHPFIAGVCGVTFTFFLLGLLVSLCLIRYQELEFVFDNEDVTFNTLQLQPLSGTLEETESEVDEENSEKTATEEEEGKETPKRAIEEPSYLLDSHRSFTEEFEILHDQPSPAPGERNVIPQWIRRRIEKSGDS